MKNEIIHEIEDLKNLIKSNLKPLEKVLEKSDTFVSGSCLYNKIYGELDIGDIDIYTKAAFPDIIDILGNSSSVLAVTEHNEEYNSFVMDYKVSGLKYQFIGYTDKTPLKIINTFDFQHPCWFSYIYEDKLRLPKQTIGCLSKSMLSVREQYMRRKEKKADKFISRFEKFVLRGLMPDEKTRIFYDKMEAENLNG